MEARIEGWQEAPSGQKRDTHCWFVGTHLFLPRPTIERVCLVSFHLSFLVLMCYGKLSRTMNGFNLGRGQEGCDKEFFLL